MLFGYARVSTEDQNLELQIDALLKAGCERTFKEKVSGKNTDRPELQKLLGQVRVGDTVMVWKLNRLGRSLKDLINLVTTFEENQISFVSLNDIRLNANWVIKWLGWFKRKFHSPAHTPIMLSINSVVFILKRLHKIRYRFMPPMLSSIPTLCRACSLFICFCWSLNSLLQPFFTRFFLTGINTFLHLYKSENP